MVSSSDNQFVESTETPSQCATANLAVNPENQHNKASLETSDFTVVSIWMYRMAVLFQLGVCVVSAEVVNK